MNFYTEDISNGYNWKGLERTIARMMGHLGWRDINVIGGAGDKGGDVIATRSDGGSIKSWVVQSKAVTGDRYIGPQAVNEAINALSFYDTNIAAVATNGEFTRTARQRQEQLTANGYTVKLWNGAFLKNIIEQMPANHAGYRKLRQYQDEIVQKVISSYEAGGKRAFYIVATGLGKTVIAATIARNLWDRGCRRILVLCHATDLALQLEQGFWPQITKEVPTSVFFDGLPPRNTEGISFGLYQSLYGYLPGIDPDQFDVVIVDEYEIIGLNLKSQLNQGFRGLVLFLLTLKIADKAIHRRQYAQNRNLSAERGAASMCSASTRHTLPTYISFRRSTELSACVDLHRLPLRHSTHVPVARAA